MTTGPLFRRIHRYGRVTEEPLSSDTVRRIIRKRAAAVKGIDGRVSGHSLRVGAAQSLAAAGAGLVALQQAGDWKSPQMPAHYARPSARFPWGRGEAPLRGGRPATGPGSNARGRGLSLPIVFRGVDATAPTAQRNLFRRSIGCRGLDRERRTCTARSRPVRAAKATSAAAWQPRATPAPPRDHRRDRSHQPSGAHGQCRTGLGAAPPKHSLSGS